MVNIYFFGGQECVGHSFAFVAQLYLLKLSGFEGDYYLAGWSDAAGQFGTNERSCSDAFDE
jgi:hypothetical protein